MNIILAHPIPNTGDDKCIMGRITPELYPVLLAVMAALQQNMPKHLDNAVQFLHDFLHAFEDLAGADPVCQGALEAFVEMVEATGDPVSAFATCYENTYAVPRGKKR